MGTKMGTTKHGDHALIITNRNLLKAARDYAATFELFTHGDATVDDVALALAEVNLTKAAKAYARASEGR